MRQIYDFGFWNFDFRLVGSTFINYQRKFRWSRNRKSNPSTGFYVVKQIFPKDFFYFYKTMLLSTDDYFIR